MCVLARPAPTINLTTIQKEMASLQMDVDYIWDAGGWAKEYPYELVEDIILKALFEAPVKT